MKEVEIPEPPAGRSGTRLNAFELRT